MTYARLLLVYVVAPIAVLTGLIVWDWIARSRRGESEVAAWSSQMRAALVTLAALALVALLYTTPWDNHLIVQHVWWYDSALVGTIRFGAIPLEEMLFFLLQTLLLGLWFLWIASHVHPVQAVQSAPMKDGRGGSAGEGVRARVVGSLMARSVVALALLILWLGAVALLLAGWSRGTYLAWELIWALPPLALQVGIGGDILWRRRRLLGLVVVPAILYLWAVDALAIRDGIWTIDPEQSLGILLGGRLPVEEVVFFSLTSALVAFGLALGLAAETRARLRRGVRALARADRGWRN